MVALLTVTSAWAAQQPPKAKKGEKGLEVLVGADAIASSEGFRPKPGKPIHYILTQTRLSMGEAVAGVKLPDPAVVEHAVVAELAKQGFIRTEVGGPVPELFIMAIVGDSNFAEPPLDDLDFYLPQVNQRKVAMANNLDPSNPLDQERLREAIEREAMRIRYLASRRFADKAKIEAFVGAEKVKKAVENLAMTRSAAERVAWAAYEDRLYVSLNAFDAAKWAAKEKVLLWRTNISIDWRNNLAASLPKMLADAGPLFGTDVAVPTFIDEKDRKAEVEIGEATVVPDAAKPDATGARKK